MLFAWFIYGGGKKRNNASLFRSIELGLSLHNMFNVLDEQVTPPPHSSTAPSERAPLAKTVFGLICFRQK